MDDQALIPEALGMEPAQVEEVAIDEAVIEDQKIAQSTMHPAWEKVEAMILAEIDGLSARPSSDLIASEYKIEDQARAKAGSILINLLDRIKHAVESVERTPRKPRGK